MLFYNFNELDNFIKDDLISNLNFEKNNLKKITNLYTNKKDGLLDIITNMVKSSDKIEKNKINNFYDTISLLKKSLNTINEIEKIAFNLDNELDYTILLCNNIENNENEIKANLIEYNKQRDELSNKIMEFENTNFDALHSSIKLCFKDKKIKKQSKYTVNINNPAKVNIELEPHDYNFLTVSEKEQKAYLPFFYNDIKTIFKNSKNRFINMQDVVNKLYVMPLDNFKNSSISRFKESFNLIRYKEHGSILKAIDLGLELMFKYELNPVIISACRNLDELDIYLDCLEQNELQNFKCFEIKFEIMPKKVN